MLLMLGFFFWMFLVLGQVFCLKYELSVYILVIYEYLGKYERCGKKCWREITRYADILFEFAVTLERFNF